MLHRRDDAEPQRDGAPTPKPSQPDELASTGVSDPLWPGVASLLLVAGGIALLATRRPASS